MGELAAKLYAQKNNGGRREDQPQGDDLSPDEKKALKKLQHEAKEAGATLHSDGKGGLSPKLVLTVLRRDKFRCKSCNKKKDLTMHHKGGIAASKWLSKKGHSNDSDNIVTLCTDCHNRMHDEAKKKGVDSSQVTPEGDEGTRRDKGLPDAQPGQR